MSVIDGAPANAWALSEPSARRSLILCGIGALFGLAIAGLGLFTAHGTRTSGVAAENVATVNQVPILMSDFIQQLRAVDDVSLAEATRPQKQKVLADMIREELYVQRGIELGMQADTIEVRAALTGSVEAQSASDATMAQPSEAELRSWYDSHSNDFADEGRLALADYVLPATSTPARIAAARNALIAARGNEAIEGRASTRSSLMTQGEEFYFAARIHLGDRLFAAARAMKPGAVSVPIILPDGIHLIVVRSNVQPVPPPFEKVRDRVLSALVAAQTKLLTAANERFLHKRADIQVARGFE
ncbi:peptidylprolyl isomerase [Sphingomonas sp.]|uniref:peptidylprolyl isomerase n=1 Tax=Sphingomonas sp. TaxID=28214 RepID=UPI0025FC10AB|nr:peptidylprolyl isomerase [Sphingomonas sp.]